MSWRHSFTHDPDAREDFTWNWVRWLQEDETIIDRTILVDPVGLTVEEQPAAQSISEDGKSVTEWITGGLLGETYKVTCQIVTSSGREADRTMQIRVRSR